MAYVDFSVLETTSKEDWFDKTRELVAECKETAEARTRKNIVEAKLAPRTITKMFGLSKTLACKVAHGQMSLPFYCVSVYCTEIENTSCHEVFFGEPAPVVVPSPAVNTMIAMADDLEKSERSAFTKYMHSRYEEEVDTVDHNQPRLINDRLEEYAHANAMSLTNLFSYAQVRTEDDPVEMLRKNMESKAGSILKSRFSNTFIDGRKPHTQMAMTVAYFLGLSMDYLLARDYTATAKNIYYKRYNPAKDAYTKVEVKSAFLRNLLSLYLCMPDELQPKFEADAILYLMDKGVTPQGREV